MTELLGDCCWLWVDQQDISFQLQTLAGGKGQRAERFQFMNMKFSQAFTPRVYKSHDLVEWDAALPCSKTEKRFSGKCRKDTHTINISMNFHFKQLSPLHTSGSKKKTFSKKVIYENYNTHQFTTKHYFRWCFQQNVLLWKIQKYVFNIWSQPASYLIPLLLSVKPF